MRCSVGCCPSVWPDTGHGEPTSPFSRGAFMPRTPIRLVNALLLVATLVLGGSGRGPRASALPASPGGLFGGGLLGAPVAAGPGGGGGEEVGGVAWRS